jgi:hypothetical protein
MSIVKRLLETGGEKFLHHQTSTGVLYIMIRPGIYFTSLEVADPALSVSRAEDCTPGRQTSAGLLARLHLGKIEDRQVWRVECFVLPEVETANDQQRLRAYQVPYTTDGGTGWPWVPNDTVSVLSAVTIVADVALAL